jgi:hypothetical protein
MFEQPKVRFSIGSLDDRDLLGVSAQYNPKELQYDRTVNWHAKDQGQMEFNNVEGRGMTVELFFDGFETHQSVQPHCAALERLAMPIEPDSPENERKRPHICVVKFGELKDGIPKLTCVIESLTVKYTMFAPTGVPLRATCTLKLKETSVKEQAKADAAAAKNKPRGR